MADLDAPGKDLTLSYVLQKVPHFFLWDTQLAAALTFTQVQFSKWHSRVGRERLRVCHVFYFCIDQHDDHFKGIIWWYALCVLQRLSKSQLGKHDKPGKPGPSWPKTSLIGTFLLLMWTVILSTDSQAISIDRTLPCEFLNVTTQLPYRRACCFYLAFLALTWMHIHQEPRQLWST